MGAGAATCTTAPCLTKAGEDDRPKGAPAARPGSSDGRPDARPGSSGSPGGEKGGLSPPQGKAGLAARRAAQGKMGGLAPVVTDKMDPRRSVIGQLHRSQGQASGVRFIEKTDRFNTMYKLGKEVMPSVHPGMDIRYATQLSDRAAVVIKVRRKANSFGNSQEEKEWRQSAEFMLNLPRSGQIAQIYGVWEDREAYYVVMEKVGGSDLFEMLDAEGLLPIDETKAVLRQLLKGVLALHEEGCIHKDLKLENVMIDRTRRDADGPLVKLIDFDTAQNWEPESPKAKTVLGTDQYISAEAYAGKYTPASDIFAVGVIAYKLLTGRFPFDSRMFDDEPGQNWVGSPKMKQIQARVQRFTINWSLPPFPANPDAVDLTKAMLAPSDQDRPLAEQALAHPFLADPNSPLLRRPSQAGVQARRPSQATLK